MKTLEEIKKERNPRLQCTKCGKWRRLYLLNGKQTMYGGDSEEGTVCVECSKTIEIWKIDLERLLWSYHENGRPDGKTGVIGNPKTIEDFVQKLFESTISQTKQELIEECICNEWDGKGISTCGFPCPVHNKNARDNRIHKKGFDAGYKKGYKVGYMEGWLNGIKKH